MLHINCSQRTAKWNESLSCFSFLNRTLLKTAIFYFWTQYSILSKHWPALKCWFINPPPVIDMFLPDHSVHNSAVSTSIANISFYKYFLSFHVPGSIPDAEDLVMNSVSFMIWWRIYRLIAEEWLRSAVKEVWGAVRTYRKGFAQIWERAKVFHKTWPKEWIQAGPQSSRRAEAKES